MREAPTSLLPKLFKSWKISHLVFERDTDAYARERDDEVVQLAKKADVEVIMKTGRTLYDPDLLSKENVQRPTMSITQVINVCLRISHHQFHCPSFEHRIKKKKSLMKK